MEFVSALFGWGLGILGTLLLAVWSERKRKRRIVIALKCEIERAKILLVYAYYRLEGEFGNPNREMIRWCVSMLSDMSLTGFDADIRSNLQKWAEAPTEQISQYYEMKRQERFRGRSIRHIDLPFLQSKTGDIDFLKSETLDCVLNLYAKVSSYNELVDECRQYFNMTFDSSLSEVNHAKTNQNLDDCYRKLAKHSQYAAELADKAVTSLGRLYKT